MENFLNIHKESSFFSAFFCSSVNIRKHLSDEKSFLTSYESFWKKYFNLTWIIISALRVEAVL